MATKNIQKKNRINIVFANGDKIDIIYSNPVQAEQDYNKLKDLGQFLDQTINKIELL